MLEGCTYQTLERSERGPYTVNRLKKKMAKAKLKTTVNDADVSAFLQSVENKKRQADSLIVLELMKEITGEEPKMWGKTIVGFSSYQYKYKSGREGEYFKVGFSPRKQSLTIYIMPGFDRYEELMQKLGKYTTGRSCLYIKKLEDVDMVVLKELVQGAYAYMQEKYE